MNKKQLDFDKCSEENKAKGDGKSDWKTSSTKVVRETVSEKVTSQKRHPWQERGSFQKIWVQDWGRASSKAWDVRQISY